MQHQQDNLPASIPEHDVELDASGLICPMPTIQAKMVLNGMAPGEILKVVATDAGTKRDLATHCRLAGHEVMGQTDEGGVIIHWIRRG